MHNAVRDPIGVSSLNLLNLGDLLDQIVSYFPEEEAEEEASGVVEEREASEEDAFEVEVEDENGKKTKKKVATDYGKIAKAMGDMRSAGIQISLVDINKSDFGFKPDVENNQILFGLKAMLNVSDDTVAKIIENRPYGSPRDFLNKVHPGKQAMISLIKGGAFDNMMDRKTCMTWYIWETCDKKKRLTLQNMNGLMKYGLVPTDTEDRQTAYKVYEFNRYLKSVCKVTSETYSLDTRAINFLQSMGYDDIIKDDLTLSAKRWDGYYQKWMDVFRNWLAANKDSVLQQLNEKIFLEDWNKYALGTISAWEMTALCFYYHEHELANVNQGKYGFSNFFDLSPEPVVEKTFVKNGKEIKMFKLYKICGTCIAKNKVKGTVTILTTDGVVNVKFRKEYFSLFDKQISERGADGVKHVKEKSWFNRGNMIAVQGIRSGDDFITKKYNSVGGHQLYRIVSIDKNGDIELQTERYKGEYEEE